MGVNMDLYKSILELALLCVFCQILDYGMHNML